MSSRVKGRHDNSSFLQDILPDHQYKVNIYALVYESPEVTVESKELHEKVVLVEGALSLYSEELDRQSVGSGSIS